MKIYLVEKGEQCEGGSILGAYLSKESAIKFALGVPTHFRGGWKEVDMTPNYWENGCDYLTVFEIEVKD